MNRDLMEVVISGIEYNSKAKDTIKLMGFLIPLWHTTYLSDYYYWFSVCQGKLYYPWIFNDFALQ